MKNITKILLASAFAIGIISCNKKIESPEVANTEKADTAKTNSTESIATVDNSQTSLDWEGNYAGVLPCADCSGIDTKIKLNLDGTYEMKQTYLDKGSSFDTKGKFQWDASGGKIALFNEKNEIINNFQVGENHLLLLDMKGNIIESKHNLTLAKTE